VRVPRLLAYGWLFHFKMFSRSAFDGLLAILWPLFFATVAFFMFRAGSSSEPLVYAALGSAVMGVWTATSVAASSALQRERWHGTLELLVAAPARFAYVLLPMTVASSTIGAYCVTATLLWGRFVFGIDLVVEQPVAFVAALAATIVSIGALGFLLAVAFVRARAAWALGAACEYPVWLVSGFLVPISVLPGWVRPISWLLAPTWGMTAVRDAASGGSPWPDIFVCLSLGLGYTLAGVLAVDITLRAARARATLSLA
jgi:ABC-2 type transport system permease protein